MEEFMKKLDSQLQDGILGSDPRPGPPLDTSGRRPRKEEQGDNGWGRSLGSYGASRGVSNSSGNPSNTLFEQRRAQGLCYKCGDKYYVGHQCKQKYLNAMIALEDPKELEGEAHPGIGDEDLTLVYEDEGIQEAISINALYGTEVPNTIRIQGEAKRIRLVKLGGNDMILGGDWMKSHNPVLLDCGIQGRGDISGETSGIERVVSSSRIENHDWRWS
ncbi:hypothetical protein FXO37_15834 [Capsicum annuum]|nr:hypothetical protein FXO37_15834 [Capsicum annuum]